MQTNKQTNRRNKQTHLCRICEAHKDQSTRQSVPTTQALVNVNILIFHLSVCLQFQIKFDMIRDGIWLRLGSRATSSQTNCRPGAAYAAHKNKPLKGFPLQLFSLQIFLIRKVYQDGLPSEVEAGLIYQHQRHNKQNLIEFKQFV